MLFHLVRVAGDNDFVGAEAQCVLLLVRRGGEDNDVGSKRVSKFYRHVAEPAETNHADFLAFSDAPVAHRRVRRDSSTKERRGSGEFEIGRDAQNEALIDYDAFGVAAVGKTSEMFVWRVEREDHVRTELFKASFAVRAGAVRVDHAADRSEIARLVLGHCRADFGDTPDNLMTWDDRVVRGHELAPLVAHRMKIRVADAAEQDFDLHVAVSWIAPRNFGGRQSRCWTGSGVSLRVVRSWMHVSTWFSQLISQHNLTPRCRKKWTGFTGLIRINHRAKEINCGSNF